jgi:hypothetical protein
MQLQIKSMTVQLSSWKIPILQLRRQCKPLQTEDPGLAMFSMKCGVHQKVAARAQVAALAQAPKQPIHSHLDLPESPTLVVSPTSFGIEEYLGDNAADLIFEAEKVCDFATRKGHHRAPPECERRSVKCKVHKRRSRTSPHIELAEWWLQGGNPVADHDALQHGAVRKNYGIDTVHTV